MKILKNKKVLILLSVILIMFALIAVSTISRKEESLPKIQVSKMLDEYKQGNFEEMEAYIKKDAGMLNNLFSSGYSQYFDDIPETESPIEFLKNNKIMIPISQNSNYRIDDVEEYESTAKVNVTLETPDIYNAMVSLLNDNKCSEITIEDIESYLASKSVLKNKQKVTFEFNLELIDGVWLVNLRNDFVSIDALSAGLLRGYQYVYQKAVEETQQAIMEDR